MTKEKILNKIQNIIGNNLTLNFMEKITGTKIFKKLPIGIDPIIDIKNQFRNYSLDTIIDVGANIGQSENSFIKKNPASTIYCIEPISHTYNSLVKNVKGAKTKCFQYAFGEQNCSIQMKVNKDTSFSVSNSIITGEAVADENFVIEDVKMVTLDSFVKENNIVAINLLKIDSEGYDLNVLRGGGDILSEQRIDFIEVEVSMNSTNTFHVNYFEIYHFLQEKNYFVFGIYEQMSDFVLKKPQLRRSNVLFISKKMIEKFPN